MILRDRAIRLDRHWREWHALISARENRMEYDQILRTQYRVADFVGWQGSGILELNPNFQRRSVWKKGAKSYLIDTIIRGLPMPIIFLRDIPADLRTFQPKRDVVDGQQRLRTVLAFVQPTLLKDFDQNRDDFRIEAAHNPNLGGKSFAQLADTDKQRILDYQFSVHSFPADTDDREILQIFARMNATGVNLNAQELRNAEFFGRFKTLAYEIATEQLNRWRDWGIFSPDQIARMNEVELTSEFMLLIMEGILEKNNPMISAFYNAFDQSFPDEHEVASRFRITLDSIENRFGETTIRRLFSSRTIFYALFATIYDLQFGLRRLPEGESFDRAQILANHMPVTHEAAKSISAEVIEHITQAAANIRGGEIPQDVLRAVRGGTSHASQRRVVIGYLAGKDDGPCRRPR
jgi:Protein of unknown function DUF262